MLVLVFGAFLPVRCQAEYLVECREALFNAAAKRSLTKEQAALLKHFGSEQYELLDPVIAAVEQCAQDEVGAFALPYRYAPPAQCIGVSLA